MGGTTPGLAEESFPALLSVGSPEYSSHRVSSFFLSLRDHFFGISAFGDLLMAPRGSLRGIWLLGGCSGGGGCVDLGKVDSIGETREVSELFGWSDSCVLIGETLLCSVKISAGRERCAGGWWE